MIINSINELFPFSVHKYTSSCALEFHWRHRVHKDVILESWSSLLPEQCGISKLEIKKNCNCDNLLSATSMHWVKEEMEEPGLWMAFVQYAIIQTDTPYPNSCTEGENLLRFPVCWQISPTLSILMHPRNSIGWRELFFPVAFKQGFSQNCK